MKGPRSDLILIQKLIKNPEDTMMFDPLEGREFAHFAIAREQRPLVDLGERQREAVGKRQGRGAGLIDQCGPNTVAIQQFDTQSQLQQVRTVVGAQLAFVEKIRDCELPREVERGF